MVNSRKAILDAVEDMVSDFLYYNRKEDEDLRMGVIESLIKSGEITVSEIVNFFNENLRDQLK